jgi:hypothetical protein
MRLVFVPPNPCARAVLIDPHLLKRIRFVPGELRDPDQKIVEKRRHVNGLLDSAAAVVISKTKANDPSISKVPVEFKGLQVQLAERSDKCSFLLFGYYLLPIAKTVRLKLSRSLFHLGEQCILPVQMNLPDG